MALYLSNNRTNSSNDNDHDNDNDKLDNDDAEEEEVVVVMATTTTTTTTPSRIAFASCNDQALVNYLWPIIAEREPSAFIWGGDAVYADRQHKTDWFQFPPRWAYLECGTPEQMRGLYEEQLRHFGYQALLQQLTRPRWANPPETTTADSSSLLTAVFGTFDDHDYGCNNADRTFPHRVASAVAYARDFLQLEQSNPMRQRAEAGRGLFGVQLYDFERQAQGYSPLVPETEARIDPDTITVTTENHYTDSPLRQPFSNKTVAVFVLDSRSNKLPWKKGWRGWFRDTEGDFLGEDQWAWLEQALQNSPATLNVVISGVQVHASSSPNCNWAESWSCLPLAQDRLFQLLLNAPGIPILVSGDVHMAQVLRKDCYIREANNNTNDGKDAVPPHRRGKAPRRLVELTTSGMTHSWGTIPNPPLHPPPGYRGVPWDDWISEKMAALMMWGLHLTMPWTALVVDPATNEYLHSLEQNYGEMDIDWDRQEISLRTLGNEKQIFFDITIPWKELKADYIHDERLEALMANGTRIPRTQQQWECVNYRGPEPSRPSLMLGHVATGIVMFAYLTYPLVIGLGLPFLFITIGKMRHRWRFLKSSFSEVSGTWHINGNTVPAAPGVVE